MRQKRNMLKTEEQGKIAQDQINEEEIGNLPYPKRIQRNDSTDVPRSQK